uniref:Secreted protein n=1 Tax=Parascaris univalens TaxID=6257 RepID=A0A915C4P6_PARUN
MGVRLFAGIIAFGARVRAYRHTVRRVLKQSRLRRCASRASVENAWICQTNRGESHAVEWQILIMHLLRDISLE